MSERRPSPRAHGYPSGKLENEHYRTKPLTSSLQTHNVAMVSPIADFVVDIGPDGRILSQGTLENALAHDSQLLKDIEHETEKLHEADQDTEIDGEKTEDVNAQSSSGKLVVAEEIEEGHIGWAACE